MDTKQQNKVQHVLTTVQIEDGSYKIVVPDYVINMLPGRITYMEVRTTGVPLKNTAYIFGVGTGIYASKESYLTYLDNWKKYNFNNKQKREAERELEKIGKGVIQLVDLEDNLAEINFDFPPKDSILVIWHEHIEKVTKNEMNFSVFKRMVHIDIGFSLDPDWEYYDKKVTPNEPAGDNRYIQRYSVTAYAVFSKETLGQLPRPIEVYIKKKKSKHGV